MPENIRLTGEIAALEIEASADGNNPPPIPKFSMLAYSGGPMRVAGFRDLTIVDLAGLEPAAQSIPIRLNHDAEQGVGHADKVMNDGKTLKATGVISRDTKASREIISSSKKGFPWQASIGASIQEREYLPEGETANINGRTVKGPLNVVRKSTLSELSFVDLGADTTSSANVAARAALSGGVTKMDLSDEVRAERARISEIEAAFDGLTSPEAMTARRKLIEEGMSGADANKEALRIVRASRPKAIPNINTGMIHAAGVEAKDVLACAYLKHTGFERIAEKAFNANAMQAGAELRCHSLIDLCAASLKLEGRTVPTDRNETIRAAFSTISMPNALASSAQKIALQIFGDTPATWRQIARIAPLQNFRTAKLIRLLLSGVYNTVGPHGELKHADMQETSGDITLSTKGVILRISRQDVINDDSGQFTNAAMSLGINGQRSISDVAWTPVATNAGSFFSSGNKNYQSGGSTVLGVDSLNDAITRMSNEKDPDGNTLDLVPESLVVPPELRFVAEQILRSTELQRLTNSNDKAPTANPLFNRLNLVVEPRLSNTTKFAGASTTAWYLFPNKLYSALAVGFLGGQETPIIEPMPQESDTLGIGFKAYLDCASALVDPLCAYMYAGA